MTRAPGVYVYFVVASVVLQFWQHLGTALLGVLFNVPLAVWLAWLSLPPSPTSWATRAALVTLVLALTGNVIVTARRSMNGSEFQVGLTRCSALNPMSYGGL